MDNVQKSSIQAVINNLSDDVNIQMKAIYKQIADTVAAQPPQRIAQTILQAESQNVNNYIKELRQQVKAASCEAMVNLGLEEAGAGIVWAKVMSNVSIPKASLCQSQDIKMPVAPNEASAQDNNKKSDLKRYKASRNAGISVAAAGTVAEIVTCIVVPEWTGAVCLAKVAGLAVIGAGVAGAAVSQQRIKEIDRIVNQATDSNEHITDIHEVINRICEYQCNANTKIICDWLEQVQDELVKQCEIETAE